MKYTLLSSVCTAAVIAAASQAVAQAKDFSGVVQFNLGMGTTETSLFSFYGELDDPLSFEGKAKGLWPLSDDIHFQGDLFVDHTDNVVKGGTHESSTLFGGTAHLLHPFENRARFGVAGSLWDTELVYDSGDYSSNATYGLAALEGQVFGSDWTVMAQAGVFSQLSCQEYCGGSVDHGSYGRAKIKYFLHDNTSLSVETLQMWGALDDSGFEGKSVTTNYSKWMLEAEHRFQDSAFSGTFGLSHERNEIDLFETTSDTDTVWLGLRYYYDQPTLRAHDRFGAELDTPDFDTANQQTSAIAGSSIVTELPD